MRRPDVYGYRNLIVLPAGHISGAPREDVKLDAKESEDDSSSILSVNFTHRNFKSNDAQQLKGGTKPATYFDILPYDAATISRSRIRIGTKNDPLNEAASGNGLTDIRGPDTKDLTEISRTSIISSSPKNLQGALNSNISLRQHLHRAYRPVFFLIFDRPSVLEHLTECDSFAAFCKRQMISPVMFVNQPTDIFCGKAHPSLYHNFDLFQVTVSGYSFHPDGKNTQAVLDSLYPSNSWLNGSSDVDLCPDKNIRHKRLTAFDNPGFVR
ncbi:unnamed protein product [Protopolystoma xenopodis]|uniref:Uncharacterized protein n=1 Tax=Protopolystoma xenopodis TaxID=117903 RepID=A0A448X8H6_9PLAT|nr:unnamed protein product [Protopolystoma xenopodis]